MTPDITLNILAERKDGVWTFFAIPDGAHTDANRLMLGSGPSGAGIMFPLAMLDQFAVGQGS
jgi:hypothetical protein